MFESTQKNKRTFSFIEKNEKIATQLKISIALIILVVSLLRGFFPILLEGLVDAKLIYFSLSGSILVYVLTFIKASNYSILPSRLIYILLLNLLFYISWLIVDLIGEVNVFFFFALAIFPFLIVIYSKVPSLYFNRIIFLLTPIIAGALIFDYLLANGYILNGNLGFDLREELRAIIVPEPPDPSHTANPFNKINGTTYRAVGLTGEEHESASILVMLSVFLLAANNQMLHLKFRILLLAMTYLALIATASAANIVMTIFASLIVIAYKFISMPKNSFLILATVLIIIIFSSSYFPSFIDFLSIPFSRLNNLEAIGIMFGQQLESNFIDEFIGLIVGHTRQLELSVWGPITEIAYFRILYTAGLPAFIVTNILWCIPFFYLCKADEYTREKMFAYVAAVYAGLFTLAHYGTLLRMTNIILFYSFFGMSIRMYVLSTDFINNTKVDSTK